MNEFPVLGGTFSLVKMELADGGVGVDVGVRCDFRHVDANGSTATLVVSLETSRSLEMFGEYAIVLQQIYRPDTDSDPAEGRS